MEDTPQRNNESADAVFQSWEWLRLVYNGVLAVDLIPYGYKSILDLKSIELVIWCVIAANVAFCAGQVVEGYASLIGIPRKIARYSVFMLGTLFAVIAGQTMISLGQVSHHPK